MKLLGALAAIILLKMAPAIYRWIDRRTDAPIMRQQLLGRRHRPASMKPPPLSGWLRFRDEERRQQKQASGRFDFLGNDDLPIWNRTVADHDDDSDADADVDVD